MCLVELTLDLRVADEVGMNPKRDTLLDVIGSCTGGDGRLAENIDEALYGEEAFPAASGLASAKQGAVGTEMNNRTQQPRRKTARNGRRRRRPKSQQIKHRNPGRGMTLGDKRVFQRASESGN